ncbi:MAG: hypothetical protein AABX33_03455 [Nanoarchaeota archaeon]
MSLIQSSDEVKRNIIHYLLLFFVIFLGVGLFVNFGFDYDGTLRIQGIKLSLFSCLIVLLPLIFLKNFFFRLLGFIGLALLAFFFEVNFGHYPDLAGLILIFLGIINAVLFLVFLGIDYIKDKKIIRIILMVILIILLTFSLFRIYKYTKIGYERRHSETITQTALQKQECEGITDSYVKGQCFTELAIRNSNPELCLKGFSPPYQLECLKKIIPITDYGRICSYFKEQENKKCLYDIGTSTKNRDACLAIPESSTEGGFIVTYGLGGKDGCLRYVDSQG